MYYIEDDNEIVLFNDSLEDLQACLEFKPEYNDFVIKETDRPIVNFEFADTPEYEEEQKQLERQRLDMLSLTKREVFLALFKDKGITPDMLKAQITSPEALIEFEYANDYFRGNPLINGIGALLGYTPEQLDYLFEHKEFPQSDTALMPQNEEFISGEDNSTQGKETLENDTLSSAENEDFNNSEGEQQDDN